MEYISRDYPGQTRHDDDDGSSDYFATKAVSKMIVNETCLEILCILLGHQPLLVRLPDSLTIGNEADLRWLAIHFHADRGKGVLREWVGLYVACLWPLAGSNH